MSGKIMSEIQDQGDVYNKCVIYEYKIQIQIQINVSCKPNSKR